MGRGPLLSVEVEQDNAASGPSNSRQRLSKVCRVDVCSEIGQTGAIKWDLERMALKDLYRDTDLYTRVESASRNKSSN